MSSTTARLAPPEYPDKIDGAVLKVAGVVVLGAIMSILDITVVNVALPTFQVEFGTPGEPLPYSTVAWTVTAYTLAYFVYNLKMLNRVTLVGERTAGAQHSGVFRRLTNHFGIAIQETPPPDNPYPVKGWEVIGVEPDVKVSQADALEVATKLAAFAIRSR